VKRVFKAENENERVKMRETRKKKKIREFERVMRGLRREENVEMNE